MSGPAPPEIRILQGSDQPYPDADINIVIDVIRAFTVAHVAFLRGVREILLVNTVEEAMTLKASDPALLLAGEIKGLGIPGFDLDNSPYRVAQAELEGRRLVQKTTNGVKATLAALEARHVFVTGYSNAMNTARHVRHLLARKGLRTVNVIASHAQDDDDLACAEYIRDQILGLDQLRVADVVERIRRSRPAAKFLAVSAGDFEPRDLDICVRAVPSGFVMEVDRLGKVPSIRREVSMQTKSHKLR
ncbi:MAG: 2-phosphosulfolactate phosphatase [Hylemonella sp.]|nr:2-phosphosulfolactate phosphatase [Hylemonella sp.]